VELLTWLDSHQLSQLKPLFFTPSNKEKAEKEELPVVWRRKDENKVADSLELSAGKVDKLLEMLTFPLSEPLCLFFDHGEFLQTFLITFESFTNAPDLLKHLKSYYEQADGSKKEEVIERISKILKRWFSIHNASQFREDDTLRLCVLAHQSILFHSHFVDLL